jgi:uncharacterized membrane protein YhaH (DUF805 family)
MGISIWQIVIILGIIAIPFILFVPILRKAGFSVWWSLCFFIPVIDIILVWVFAFIEWPVQKEHNKSLNQLGAENAPFG